MTDLVARLRNLNPPWGEGPGRYRPIMDQAADKIEQLSVLEEHAKTIREAHDRVIAAADRFEGSVANMDKNIAIAALMVAIGPSVSDWDKNDE